MQCKTFSHIDKDGRNYYKSKKAYKTHEEAIDEARMLNLNRKRKFKVVPYKCIECGKYHLGRTGKPITPDYREKLKEKRYQEYTPKYLEDFNKFL